MSYIELLEKINRMYINRNINIMNSAFEPYDRYIEEFYSRLNEIQNQTPEEESLIKDFINLYKSIPKTNNSWSRAFSKTTSLSWNIECLLFRMGRSDTSAKHEVED